MLTEASREMYEDEKNTIAFEELSDAEREKLLSSVLGAPIM